MCLNEIKINLQEAEDRLCNLDHNKRLNKDLSELEIALAHCLVLIERAILEESK